MSMTDFIIDNGILKPYYGNESHVVIPDGVTKIGEVVFSDCTELTSIEIPSSVTSIGYGAFSLCTSLKNIKIPNSVTEIGNRVFFGCTSLKNIDIPNSIKSIGYYEFEDCKNLTSIKIHDSVTSIGCCAFKGIAKVKPQYNTKGKLRAFKAFNADWTCRGFKYEVGKKYHQNGEIECCHKGFHACPNPLDVFNYYWGKLSRIRFAEVELSGEKDWSDDKVAASDIKIIKEVSYEDLFNEFNRINAKS